MNIQWKDIFPFGGSANIGSIQSFNAEVNHNNLLGLGDKIQINALYDLDRRPLAATGFEYTKRNLLGSFVNLTVGVDKFKPAKNKKAYSYFGTICKNYLMGQIIKDQKEQNRKISYEDITTKLESRPDMIYYLENEKIEATDVIKRFIKELNDYIESTDLNNNELKLGYALMELFENYNNIFIGTDNNKFNKNIILLSLRDMTNMSTKEIRTSMRKYKKLYYELTNKLHNL